MIRFDVLSIDDMDLIVKWRAKNPEGARTPYLLTLDNEYDFYNEVISNRLANARYWAVRWEDEDDDELLGMVGLNPITWESRRGEVSIIIDPDKRGLGIGTEAIAVLLEKAFEELNLEYVYGEVYTCNKYYAFWEAMVEHYNGKSFITPWVTKLWHGVAQSMLFQIDVDGYDESTAEVLYDKAIH